MTVIRGILTTWPGRLFAVALVAVVAGGAVVASRINAQPPKTEIRTQAVAKGSVVQSVAVSGSVNATSQVKLAFKSAGKVSAVYVSVGQTVTAGQALAAIDTTDLQAALAQAQQNLKNAQLNYDKAAQSASDAQRSYDQTVQTTQNNIASAQQALAKLQANYATAKTNSNVTMSSVFTDIQTFQSGLDTIFSQLDKAFNEPAQSGSDWKSAMNAIYGALTPITNDRSFSSSFLSPALSDYQRSQNSLGVAVAEFDAALAAGNDTSSQSASFTTAMGGYNLTVSRLNGAIDTTTSPLSQISSAVISAQGFLNSSTSRFNLAYDPLRADLATLLSTVTNEQQLSASTKTKISQGSTSLGTVNDAISGSLVTAMNNIASAQQQAATSVQSAQTNVANQPFNLASAKTSVDNASTAVATAQTNLDAATLTAPASGVVASIASSVGENTASPFLVLANTAALSLHGTIGETDVAKIKLGQVANVTVDAVGTSARMTGKVTSVDPVATIQQGVPVYGIDVTIDLASPAVRAGMTGTATVIIASKQNVLVVPNLAIRSTAGRRYVQILKDGEAVDTDVTFGIANDTVTEVVSGLAEGDLVVLPAARATATNANNRGGFGGGGGGGPVIIGR